jgi:hypothetical protein
VNRIVAALLAAALSAAGVIAVVEIIYAALDREPAVVDWRPLANALARNEFHDLGPRIAAGGIILAGAVLLVLGLWRGRPATLPLRSDAPHVEASTSRRSLQQALRATVLATAGVSAAKVRVGRHHASVRATSLLPAEADMSAQIERRLTEALTSLRLAEPLALRIKTKDAA